MRPLTRLADDFARSATGRYRHLVLLSLLGLLWLALYRGPDSAAGRLFWLADVAVFLVWQPLVQANRRLQPLSVLFLFVGVSLLTTLLDWGWLALWTLFVSAMVGGKVLVAPRRRDRWFYVLVFLELATLLLLWISPRLISDAQLIDHPVIAWVHVIAAAVIVLATLVMPRAEGDGSKEVFDFLTGFFVLLLLAVLLLGTSTVMFFAHLSYFDSLTLVIFATAALLLVVSWWASPRPGNGGIEALLTAYLLRVGFPFEVWLKSLMQLAERFADADVFLDESMAVFARIPWVVGGECVHQGSVYRFGDAGAGVARFSHRGTRLQLFTSHAWSASLLLQASLIFRLIVELAEAKRREATLSELRYLRSVHEAGARVTHDVKNLLQSLDNLCFATLSGADDVPDHELRAMLGRQLPVISERLRLTLDKFRDPGHEDVGPRMPASEWWVALQARYERSGVEFVNATAASTVLPAGLFDHVADNLIGNALEKRAASPALRVRVALLTPTDDVCFSVTDSGPAVTQAVVEGLFKSALPSETGLGIGLLQSARLAERHGYRLALADNRGGCVRFTLSPRASGESQAPGVPATDRP